MNPCFCLHLDISLAAFSFALVFLVLNDEGKMENGKVYIFKPSHTREFKTNYPEMWQPRT